MAESAHHMFLVRELYKWVCEEAFNGDSGHVYADLPELIATCKPPVIAAGVRPDLYAKRLRDNLLVLGEAKTAGDWESRHSILQYHCFIEECELHLGPSLIVMAVPWHVSRAVKNYFAYLQKKKKAEKTKVEVLEQLPG